MRTRRRTRLGERHAKFRPPGLGAGVMGGVSRRFADRTDAVDALPTATGTPIDLRTQVGVAIWRKAAAAADDRARAAQASRASRRRRTGAESRRRCRHRGRTSRPRHQAARPRRIRAIAKDESFATNTSTLPITEIEANARLPRTSSGALLNTVDRCLSSK